MKAAGRYSRVWLLLWPLLVVVLLGGCVKRTDEDTGRPGNPSVHRDHETGCEYLGNGATSTALTPRIAADGKTHMGCKGKQP